MVILVDAVLYIQTRDKALQNSGLARARVPYIVTTMKCCEPLIITSPYVAYHRYVDDEARELEVFRTQTS